MLHSKVRIACVGFLIGMSVVGGRSTAQNLTSKPYIRVNGGLHQILESQNREMPATHGLYYSVNTSGEPGSLALVIGIVASTCLYPIVRKRFSFKQILRPSRP